MMCSNDGTHQLVTHVLSPDLRAYEAALPEDRARERGELPPLLTLARALAASPALAAAESATVVARPMPTPLLGVAASAADEREAERLRSQCSALDSTLSVLRYVTYAQVEAACEDLARGVVDRVGSEALGACDFVAVPRGGYVVLGLLSYLLDLAPRQLEPDGGSDTVVVIDDCALSGRRFREQLESLHADRVVFAPLFSAPGLRDAIESAEPRVIACVSGRDLSDHARARHGEDYEAWHRRWEARGAGESYWQGQPEHVCFPWTEPEVTVWNPAAEREEVGLGTVPPELCLKRRSLRGRGTGSRRVQLQPEARGPLRPSDRVLYFDWRGECTVVVDVERDLSFRLEGTEAELWKALVEEGTREGMVDRLTSSYEVSRSAVERDANRWLSRLTSLGLVEGRA